MFTVFGGSGKGRQPQKKYIFFQVLERLMILVFQQFELYHYYSHQFLLKYETDKRKVAPTKNTNDYVKIHETEKSGCTLQLTQKRAKTITEEFAKANIKGEIELTYKSSYDETKENTIKCENKFGDPVKFFAVHKDRDDMMIDDEIHVLKCVKKKLPVFFLIADPDWVAKSIKALNSSTKINIIENIDNCSKGYLNILPTKNKVKFGFKKSYYQNVPAIIESLNLSIKLAKERKVSGIVTLPVMKKTLMINLVDLEQKLKCG